MPDIYTYPEETFRSWERQRTYYDGPLAHIVSEVIGAELGNRPLILDPAAGEGYGRYLLELAGSDVELLSTDYDHEALSLDRWLPNDEAAIRCAADYLHLPFQSDKFDGVLSISGIQTIDPETFVEGLEEVHRLLKPSGKLLLTNDTRRGLSYIFDDPLLMSAVRPDDDEIVIATYDGRGEICQPVIVETEALNLKMAAICYQLGITPFTGEQYPEIMQAENGEMHFISLYARAAQVVLAQKRGSRPFEYNSNGGSWNRYYFDQIIDELRLSRGRFKVKELSRQATALTSSEVVTTPAGEELFVSKWQRDSVGNLYATELSRTPVETAGIDINAHFIVAEKV